MMLEWGEMREKLDEMERVIQAEVLKLEQTQTVGNVRASYSKGRGSYDYERAVTDAGIDTTPWEKVVVDWRTACKENELPVPYTPGTPSVSVKLI